MNLTKTHVRKRCVSGYVDRKEVERISDEISFARSMPVFPQGVVSQTLRGASNYHMLLSLFFPFTVPTVADQPLLLVAKRILVACDHLDTIKPYNLGWLTRACIYLLERL